MPLPTSFTFSQSSLQDYADCPRRFQLRYIEQLQWPAVESEPVLENEKHQQEGLLFHRLAQQYLIGLPVEKLTKLANTPNLERWWENFVNDKVIQNLKELDGLYPEMGLTAPVGPHRLVAKYDLIAIRLGEEVLIFDWKTYRKRPRDEWMAVRWQTRVYRALLAQAGSHLNGGQPIDPARIEMVYWYADYPSEPARFTYNATQAKRDWNLIESTVAEISASQSFPMTSDEKKCRFCPYRSYCDRGTQAGDWQQAEAEMEAEVEAFDINFEQIGEIAF
jgi:CRISPR/Cas system-associated exonuclease Cas4 (RecB family)